MKSDIIEIFRRIIASNEHENFKIVISTSRTPISVHFITFYYRENEEEMEEEQIDLIDQSQNRRMELRAHRLICQMFG